MDLRLALNQCPLWKSNYKGYVRKMYSMYCVLLLIQEVTFYSRHFQLLDIICAKKRKGHKLDCHAAPLSSHPPPSIWHRARKRQTDGDSECSQMCILNNSKLHSELDTKAACGGTVAVLAADGRLRPLEGIIESY